MSCASRLFSMFFNHLKFEDFSEARYQLNGKDRDFSVSI